MLTIILSGAAEYQVGGNLVLEETNFTNSSAADCYFGAHAARSEWRKDPTSTRCLIIYDLSSRHINRVAGN